MFKTSFAGYLRHLFFLVVLIALASDRCIGADPAVEIDWDACQDNQAIDVFLRKASPLYAAMARLVQFHGGYRFEDQDALELGCWNAGKRTIEIGSRLRGAHRATIIAFEMTNAYQQRLHTDVDQAARSGTITTPSEFALRHELIEYDGLRLHRKMLQEIEQQLGSLPADFFLFVNRKPKTVADYELPLVTDFLKQMESSGHSAYYHQWFPHQRQAAPTAIGTLPDSK